MAQHAVVSPTGMIHAVRPKSLACACGVDYRRKRFTRGPRGWTRLLTDFDELNARREGRQICRNCLENLQLGTGR